MPPNFLLPVFLRHDPKPCIIQGDRTEWELCVCVCSGTGRTGRHWAGDCVPTMWDGEEPAQHPPANMP